MATHSLSFDDDGANPSTLLCPACGGDYVHLDDVYVAGRPREDEDAKTVHVDHRGTVDHLTPVPLGAGGLGRRHTITLGGFCELCHERFAVAFKQHKGQTFVSILTRQWTLVTGSTSVEEPPAARGLDVVWIENDDPQARTTVVRASEIAGVRQGGTDDEGTLEVLVAGTWEMLARIADHHELGLMAESLTYLLMTPDTEAGSYMWRGSSVTPPTSPHEWDWELSTVPFGPIKD